ncbi:hypothetical protein [Alteromonas antoniana]|uniref:hypothetical protein n=1 Tax=Alteromonas antoniana TaxID=2803813 RepID=UPI001C44201D|nr:hypothetical protein [Alteromonas antoniana]
MNISPSVQRFLANNSGLLNLIVVAFLVLVMMNDIAVVDQKVTLVGEMLDEVQMEMTLESEPYSNDQLMKDIAASERFSRVYMGNMVRNQDMNSSSLLSFYGTLKDEMERDSVDRAVFQRFNKGVGATVASFDEQNNQVSFYDKWRIQVSGPESLWVTNFPKSPFLAFNSEFISFPTCAEGKEPTIAAEEVARGGRSFKGTLVVKEFEKLNAWQVNFQGVGLLDATTVMNQRALIITACK